MADPIAQPQAGENDQPQAGTDVETPAVETISLDEAKKLRSEAKSLRQRLKAFEDAETAAKQAQLSEQEKLNQRASAAETEREQLRQELRQERAANAIASAAAKVGIPAELAAQLVKVEFDDDGKPKNVEQAVRELAAKYPNLAGGHASVGNPARGSGSGGSPIFTTAQIADRAFWKANEKAIMQAMREGRIVEG